MELFRGLTDEQRERVLADCGAFERKVAARAYLMRRGEVPEGIMLVLEGRAHAFTETPTSQALMRDIGPGEAFGDALAVLGRVGPVDIRAVTPMRVLYLPVEPLLASTLPEAHVVVRRLMEALAERVLELTQRSHILSHHRLRDKVMALLHAHETTPGKWFTLPYDRERMAQVLCCDRSALSRLLGDMQKQGEIEVRGRAFCL